MCYLVRQQQADASFGAAQPHEAGHGRRHRLGAAVAAIAMGGIALAALLAPAPTAPLPPPAAGADTAVLRTSLPAEPVATQGLAPDDGVPADTQRMGAGVGGCSH